MTKHDHTSFRTITDARREKIEALVQDMPDDDRLSLLSDLLKPFSGHYSYDRAVDAIEELREDVKEEPWDMSKPLPRVTTVPRQLTVPEFKDVEG